METTFHIMLSIKTANGFESFGRFLLGHDREAAYRIFQQLRGNRDISDTGILHAELVETRNELPVNIQLISCTLKEVAENCGIITKEIFKQLQ
jgi:hypothetical protein